MIVPAFTFPPVKEGSRKDAFTFSNIYYKIINSTKYNIIENN
jgi:hypothetical protein